MIVKDLCNKGNIHTLVFEILGNEYVLECVMKRKNTSVKITNTKSNTKLKGYGILMIESALKNCLDVDSYLEAQSFTIYLLYIMKGLNLGFKIEPSNENREKLLDFLYNMLHQPVTLDYKVDLYSEEVSEDDLESQVLKIGKLHKYTILSNITMILSRDLGILVLDNVNGKWYKANIDANIEAYIIMQYGIGDSEVEPKRLLSKLGLFIKACMDYNK